MKLNKWILAALFIGRVASAAVTGAAAPDFSAVDSKGETVKLSDFKGKTVVLEWLNYGCPFVQKHYGAGNMQALQSEAKGKGVVWISVISSAPGKQGAVTPKRAEADRKAHRSGAAYVILDGDGRVGKLYAAKTTPHMFVINAEGKLVYQGAIDDKPSTDQADIKAAHNYVKEAMEHLAAKPAKAIATAETQPYGCSVKY